MKYSFWQICCEPSTWPCGTPRDRELYEIQNTVAMHALITALILSVVTAIVARTSDNCCAIFMVAVIVCLVAYCALAA